MPSVYPYASSERVSEALTAIGAEDIGRSEVPLYKQILVAISTGTPAPPGPERPTLAPVLTLVSADDYLVDLSWTASNNLDAGTGYTLAYSYDGNPVEYVPLGDVLEYQFNGEAISDGDYEFYIIPYNSAGDALAPAWSNVVEVALPVDPLAPINASLALRLQTHNGDNVPLGLYTDVAGTIPAVEWDLVACWRDELSGSGREATQSDVDLMPMLVFVDGVPWLMPDGIDDTLVLSSGISPTTTLTCFTGAELSNISGLRSILSPVAANGGPWFWVLNGKLNLYNDNVAALTESTTAVANDQSFIGAVRLRTDGLDYFLDGAGDGTSGDTTTFTAPIAELFTIKGAAPFTGRVTSVLVSTSALSDPNVSLVNTYLATLI